MTSSFDQPDDSSVWRWMDGDELDQVRTSEDMLQDLDDAFDLLDELASACDPIGLGDWEQDACTESDDEPRGDPIVCPLPDLTRFGEPLLVASAGHLLEQVALVQSAVSLMIVIGRSKHWPEEFEFMGKPVDQSTSAEQILNHPGEELGTHCTQIEPDVIQGHRCHACHLSEQQHGLWLKSVAVADGSLNTESNHNQPSMKADHQAGVIGPVSLGTETNTIYVAFDGKNFVKVPQPKVAPQSPASESGKADVASRRTGVLPSKSPDIAESATPSVMRRRNELMWGPHWTQKTSAEDKHQPEINCTASGINQEDCVDNAAFPRAASPHRALPGSDVVQSHRRNNATRSRYPLCNATPETCRAIQPSSHSSAECRDRRSCTVRDPKGDR